MRKTLMFVPAVLLIATVAAAHVTVWPRESRAGGSERYTVRVPTEGRVATTSVELEVPAGVTITGILAPAGWSHETRKDGDRLIAITWAQEIKPGEFGEFVFLARNPRDAQEIVWKVHQRYADGTASDWVGAPGERGPAPVTKLTPPEPR